MVSSVLTVLMPVDLHHLIKSREVVVQLDGSSQWKELERWNLWYLHLFKRNLGKTHTLQHH